MSSRTKKIRPKLRGRVLERSGFRCANCGKTRWNREPSCRVNAKPSDLKYDGNWAKYRWLEIHHKDGNHENNAIRNLVALCVLCHWFYTIQTGCAKACGLGKRGGNHDRICTCFPKNRRKFSLLPNGRRVKSWPQGNVGLQRSGIRQMRQGDGFQWVLREAWNKRASVARCRKDWERQLREEKEKRARTFFVGEMKSHGRFWGWEELTSRSKALTYATKSRHWSASNKVYVMFGGVYGEVVTPKPKLIGCYKAGRLVKLRPK